MSSDKSLIPHVVFGEPVERAGTTVIPVTREGRFTSKAVGAVVIDPSGESKWVAAVDYDRIAKIGLLTGLVTGTIATLAVLRQPPWPSQETMLEMHRSGLAAKRAR